MTILFFLLQLRNRILDSRKRNLAARYTIHILLAALLGLGTASVRADQLSSLKWNCWVNGQEPLRISCIHERNDPLPNNVPDTDTELENQLLDQLRENTRSQKAAVLKGMEWKNIEMLHKESQWTVLVHAYPDGALLGKKQVSRLTGAVLCPAGISCTVKVRKLIQK